MTNALYVFLALESGLLFSALALLVAQLSQASSARNAIFSLVGILYIARAFTDLSNYHCRAFNPSRSGFI